MQGAEVQGRYCDGSNSLGGVVCDTPGAWFGYVGWWDFAAGILTMNRETEMGKRKGKRDVKVHKFFKWLMAHITSIGIGVFLITCCLVVVTISVMAIYAWIGRKTIKISFDEGWPPRSLSE